MPNEKKKQKKILNRRARYDYEIQSQIEAGIILKGNEVKSIRLGKVVLDNAYAIIKKGGIANLTLTKPAGVFFMERYDYILTTQSMIKFENDLKVYGVDNNDYDINLGRKHFKNNNIYNKEEIEKVIATGPHNDPMGQINTKKISENFIKSIIEDRPELRNNSFLFI